MILKIYTMSPLQEAKGLRRGVEVCVLYCVYTSKYSKAHVTSSLQQTGKIAGITLLGAFRRGGSHVQA